MKYLLDSHILLWAIFDRSRLPKHIRSILEDDAHELFVSIVSLWELAVKLRIGKLQLPGSSTEYLLEQVEITGMAMLAVKTGHVLRLETLPAHHKDPWDRMIIAQAFEEGCTVLSVDAEFPPYGVPLVRD